MVQRAISRSCGNTSVLLDLRQYFWALSGVPSRKSRLLKCLIGNMELLCMQCRGIGPNLAVRGTSQCFSLVAAGTLVYYRDPAGMLLQARVCPSYKGHLRNFLEAWQSNRDASPDEAGDHDSLSSCHNDIGIPVNFQQESGLVTFSSIELGVPLKVSKEWEASCPDEAETWGFL